MAGTRLIFSVKHGKVRRGKAGHDWTRSKGNILGDHLWNPHLPIIVDFMWRWWAFLFDMLRLLTFMTDSTLVVSRLSIHRMSCLLAPVAQWKTGRDPHFFMVAEPSKVLAPAPHGRSMPCRLMAMAIFFSLTSGRHRLQACELFHRVQGGADRGDGDHGLWTFECLRIGPLGIACGRPRGGLEPPGF